MSIESVMPSNHFILYHRLLLLPQGLPTIRVFSNESVLPIRWPKYWSFSFSISPSNEYLELISFRVDLLDLLAVQRTLKNLLQYQKLLSHEWAMFSYLFANFIIFYWEAGHVRYYGHSESPQKLLFENWTIKKAECQGIDAFISSSVVLKKTLESPLDSKESKPVNPKGNQPWIFIGRTDAEAPILWPPDIKSWLTGKDPDSGKDWRQKKRAAENKMVRYHHWLNGHESEQIPGDSGEWRNLGCCSSWGYKKSNIT